MKKTTQIFKLRKLKSDGTYTTTRTSAPSLKAMLAKGWELLEQPKPKFTSVNQEIEAVKKLNATVDHLPAVKDQKIEITTQTIDAAAEACCDKKSCDCKVTELPEDFELWKLKDMIDWGQENGLLGDEYIRSKAKVIELITENMEG